MTVRMVAFVNGLLIPAERCDKLARVIGRRDTLATQVSDEPTPEDLLDFLEDLRAVAEDSSARFHGDSGRNLTDQALVPSSEWLTTKEAARRAEVSARYMRRVFREGDVEASRGARGAWLVDTDSFGAWLASRQAHSPKAA
jgi:hypothetical protein